ncbi:hypothetical protein DdX_05206 [Ditylenchus destructor]|uniref:Uncharacterized protein n=1 Tax=Ditylenchus destructor TaxID=166010 RepID=A0AAD4R483_9BILA|nr:hypothetical protein DdX_05206 [Ditylenchus destructor]
MYRQLSPTKQILPLRSSSPGDDSQCGDDSSLQHNVGLLHSMNRFLFSCYVMQLRHAIFLIALIILDLSREYKEETLPMRPSSPGDDSQCGDDSSLQHNEGLLHSKILSTETIMDFSSCDVDLMVLQHSDGVAL